MDISTLCYLQRDQKMMMGLHIKLEMKHLESVSKIKENFFVCYLFNENMWGFVFISYDHYNKLPQIW
jgi:hypothetical protein